MTPRGEASDQEVRVLAHVRGAGLNFTENLGPFCLSSWLPLGRSPSPTCGFAQRRPTTELRTAPFGDW